MQRRTLFKYGVGCGVAAAISVPFLNTNASTPAVTVLTPKKSVTWADYLGVNAHFLWFQPDNYTQQIQQLKTLGLKWVRIDIHWAFHEAEPGKWQLDMVDKMMSIVAANNLKVMVYLVGSAPFASSAPAGAPYNDQYPPKDPEVFADRIAMLAKRYPQVSVWQIWNEPNILLFWRPSEDPVAYDKLFRSSVTALRKAVPDKPIAMAGMAYYSQMPVRGGLMLEELGKLGSFSLNTIVAYHPYSEFPEGDIPADQDFIARVNTLNPRLRSAGVKDIWATEFGWSSYNGPKEMQALIGESGQADYLLRRLAIMSTQDFDRIFLFALSDLDSRASVRDQSYGLLRTDLKQKPAYQALRRFLTLMGTQVTPTAPVNAKADATGLYSISWLRDNTRKLWLFWGATATTATVSGVSRGTLHDPLSGQIQKLTAQAGVLRVPVKTSLQILELD
jgi:beta-xylosidase